VVHISELPGTLGVRSARENIRVCRDGVWPLLLILSGDKICVLGLLHVLMFSSLLKMNIHHLTLGEARLFRKN